jgi:hypothetical protein
MASSRIVFCFMLLLLSSNTAWAVPETLDEAGTPDAAGYWEQYQAHCLEAVEYAKEIRPRLLKALDNDPLLTGIGMAVVFPELTRYSYLQDAIETSALEFSYLFYGNVDFSIGKMQMKPSFAAMLEIDAPAGCRTRFPELFQPAGDPRSVRGSRLARLKNPDLQIEYFAVFLTIMTSNFPALAQDAEQAVRIFSAAYNAGYNRTPEELAEWAGRAYFPHGKYAVAPQYSYAEIALDYYRRYER